MKTESFVGGGNRLWDVLGAAAGLILLVPVFVAIAVLVVWDSGSPVFFRQRRLGRNGRPFWILKFRTMRAGSGGRSLASAGDLRVTRVGRWLRRSKLDELPQLVNVLRGEMSFIGPRPEVPEYIAIEDPVWKAVLEAVPGITDLASLAFRDEEKLLGSAADPEAFYRTVILPAKLRLNLRYRASRSMRRDLKLLWLTARFSIFDHGFTRDRILRSFEA